MQTHLIVVLFKNFFFYSLSVYYLDGHLCERRNLYSFNFKLNYFVCFFRQHFYIEIEMNRISLKCYNHSLLDKLFSLLHPIAKVSYINNIYSNIYLSKSLGAKTIKTSITNEISHCDYTKQNEKKRVHHKENNNNNKKKMAIKLCLP